MRNHSYNELLKGTNFSVWHFSYHSFSFDSCCNKCLTKICLHEEILLIPAAFCGLVWNWPFFCFIIFLPVSVILNMLSHYSPQHFKPHLVLLWHSDELSQGVKQVKNQSYKKGMKSAHCTDSLSHAILGPTLVIWE